MIIFLEEPHAASRGPERDSHAGVIADKVAHGQVVVLLGQVQSGRFVLGLDVAIGALLQQEAHNVGVAPLACLVGGQQRHWSNKPKIMSTVLRIPTSDWESVGLIPQ